MCIMLAAISGVLSMAQSYQQRRKHKLNYCQSIIIVDSMSASKSSWQYLAVAMKIASSNKS